MLSPSVPHIKLLPPKRADENKPAKGPISTEPIDDNMEEDGKCIFCPAEFHDSIITLVESHLCAHLLIPRVLSPNTGRHTRMGHEAKYISSAISTSCVKHGLTCGRTGIEMGDGKYGHTSATHAFQY